MITSPNNSGPGTRWLSVKDFWPKPSGEDVTGSSHMANQFIDPALNTNGLASPIFSGGQTSVRPIRVGFVLHAMQVAGAEVLVMETIRRTAGRIEPVIFCLDKVGDLGEQLRAVGVEVVCFNRRPGRDFGVAWRMARAIREHRIEVLHAHQYTPFFYAALARVLAGGAPRLILTEHGRNFPDNASPLRRLTNRLLLRSEEHTS